MSYLNHLKELYQKEITSLENEFNNHCQKVIDEKIKEMTPKIKDEIENNILEHVSNYIEYNNESIQIEDIDLTNIYDSKYRALFAEHLKSDDQDNVEEAVENFIEELESFETIKKYLQVRFDGLMFDTFIHVSVQKDGLGWSIRKIVLSVYADISLW